MPSAAQQADLAAPARAAGPASPAARPPPRAAPRPEDRAPSSAPPAAAPPCPSCPPPRRRHVPDRDIGTLAHGDLPAIVAPQHLGPAARGKAQRFARAHRPGALRDPLQQHRLPRLTGNIPRIVGGRAINAQPHGTPASRIARSGAMPDPSRQFEHGQCATPVRVRAKRSISCASIFTQCACQTSAPVQPRSSAYCPGRQPNFSSL